MVKDNTSITHGTWRSQAGAHPQPPPLQQGTVQETRSEGEPATQLQTFNPQCWPTCIIRCYDSGTELWEQPPTIQVVMDLGENQILLLY